MVMMGVMMIMMNLSMTVAKKTEKAAERTLMRIPRLLANFSEM